MAGTGQERKKKKTWSVVAEQATSIQMSELTYPYRALSDVHEAVREGTLDVVERAIARAKRAKKLNDLDGLGLSGLHHAVRYNRYDAVVTLLEHGAEVNITSRNENNTPLHITSRKVCEKLIKLGADVNARDNLMSTPLMAAASHGGIKTCEALLEKEVKIDDVNSNGDTALLEAVRYDHVSVVELLLDCGASVSMRNEANLGLFDTAVKYGSSNAVLAICQHQRWREVLNDKSGPTSQPPMKLLIAHFPDAAKLIMDKCVQPDEHMSPADYDYTVTYDFQLLDPGPDDPAFVQGTRYFGPEVMVQNNQANLLLHPLTQVLLEKKWSSLGKIGFYLSFCFFLVFTALYTEFLKEERETEEISFSDILYTQNTSSLPLFLKYSENRGGAKPLFILIFAVAQMFKEVLQMLFQRKMYFTQPSNFMEWVLYATTTVFVIPYVAPYNWLSYHYGAIDYVDMWHFALLSIFLCYVDLVLYLRRFLILGLYITMHLQVLLTVIKVMAAFISILFGFSVVFSLVFKEQNAFAYVLLAFLKVNVMMIGEMDYDDTFIKSLKSGDAYAEKSRNRFADMAFVFFFLFVLIIGISLMNLLVGLAVGDIDKIQREATLKRQAMQVEFVWDIEDKYPRFITRKVYKQTLVVKPNQPSFLKRLKRKFIKTKDEMKYESHSESLDGTKELSKKIDKTRKHLTNMMECQNRLLQALARKIAHR